MNVRLAALRCASKVVAAASFPRTDRLAMMDVLVRCLRDMREEAQAAAGPRPREEDYSDEFEAVATLWRFDEGEDRWTGGAKGTMRVLTHRSLADNLLFTFLDEEGKLMAYHPFPPDERHVKVDDATWEWRAEKDYADDGEGFAEQFRLSLQSSESASRFQHYVAGSNRQNRGLADAAFSGPSPAWTAVQHVSLAGNAVVRNPFLAALPQHPFGRVGSARASTNSFVTTFPQPAAPGSSPTPGSNPFAAYKPAEAASSGLFNLQFTPAPGTSATPPPPGGVAVEDEFVAAAQKAFGSYSVFTRQTFVDAVLRAAIHGPAKNVKRPASDDRSSVDVEYRLAALTALRTWCESDVTSEPGVACCPAAQRLVDNGGAVEVALVGIASYDPISHAVSNEWAGWGVMDTLFHSSHVVMTILQKHVRPGAIRRSLGRRLVHLNRSARDVNSKGKYALKNSFVVACLLSDVLHACRGSAWII
jgi:Ran-binding protein 1